MIVSRIICDGCGADAGDRRLPCESAARRASFIGTGGSWLVISESYPVRHYCPTCRRAIEAEDLTTALVAPRKGIS
jgi:hypothetical protein